MRTILRIILSRTLEQGYKDLCGTSCIAISAATTDSIILLQHGFNDFSPNRSLRLWGPSFESYNRLGCTRFSLVCPQNPSCDFCHWSLLIFTIPDFWNLWSHRMLLWPPPGSKFHTASNFSSYAATCWPTKKLLWPPRGSKSRCCQHYVHICYIQNHQKTSRIYIKVGRPMFLSCAPLCIFVTKPQ